MRCKKHNCVIPLTQINFQIMKRLTKREEEVMSVIWDMGRALVNDITPRLPITDLPYTTVSSIVRILEKKGFVDHKSYGRTHEYFPLISKEEYRNSQMKSFVKRYFDSSYQNVVSYFVNEKKLSAEDLKSLIEIIEKKQDNE
mgnify:CR=1 FL=1